MNEETKAEHFNNVPELPLKTGTSFIWIFQEAALEERI